MTLSEKLEEMRMGISSRSLTKDTTQEGSMDSETCPICGGLEWTTEMIDGVGYAFPCKCRAKNMMKRRIRFAEIPEAFKDMHLNTFRSDVYKNSESKAKIILACKMIKEYLKMFDEAKNSGMGLYIYSKAKGSGKTRMAASIANELIEKHDTCVKFASSTQILSEIKRTFDMDSEYTESHLLDALIMAEVLVIDDFGTEKVTEWVKDRFYQIVNSRYINRKVTIYTSNESLETLKYDDRITNRIKERSYQIDFPEESVRDHISQANMIRMISKVMG